MFLNDTQNNEIKRQIITNEMVLKRKAGFNLEQIKYL
jgi:hypothetical protein